MEIVKSSRHSKITGDFTESLILYWLSKYGFECALVDHTGIDIIAKNPKNKEVMGISVKSRSRNEGTENVNLAISNDNFLKVQNACDAFGCKPYFALVVDAGTKIRAYILKMEYLQELFPAAKTTSWKMSKSWMEKYDSDPQIKKFEFEHKTTCWW